MELNQDFKEFIQLLNEKTVDYLVDKFCHITKFSFEAKSTLGNNGWNGVGEGEVKVSLAEGNVVVFEEKGFFITPQQKKLACKNVYRWTFQKDIIQLEHLRFGFENPVFLFSLVPKNLSDWVSACPHLCDKDSYNANLTLMQQKIMIVWHIKGEKDETISYIYE